MDETSKKATIKDVAELANVSFKTVSRVVNRDLCVRETTKNKVIRAIEKLNYKPNLAARKLREKTDLLDIYLYQVHNESDINAIKSHFSVIQDKNEQEVLFFPIDDKNSLTSPKQLLRIINKLSIDTLIISPSLKKSGELLPLASELNLNITTL